MKVLIDIEFLKKIEWLRDEFTGWTGGRCPCCGGYKYGGDDIIQRLHPGEFEGHKEDCELHIALTSSSECES